MEHSKLPFRSHTRSPTHKRKPEESTKHALQSPKQRRPSGTMLQSALRCGDEKEEEEEQEKSANKASATSEIPATTVPSATPAGSSSRHCNSRASPKQRATTQEKPAKLHAKRHCCDNSNTTGSSAEPAAQANLAAFISSSSSPSKRHSSSSSPAAVAQEEEAEAVTLALALQEQEWLMEETETQTGTGTDSSGDTQREEENAAKTKMESRKADTGTQSGLGEEKRDKLESDEEEEEEEEGYDQYSSEYDAERREDEEDEEEEYDNDSAVDYDDVFVMRRKPSKLLSSASSSFSHPPNSSFSSSSSSSSSQSAFPSTSALHHHQHTEHQLTTAHGTFSARCVCSSCALKNPPVEYFPCVFCKAPVPAIDSSRSSSTPSSSSSSQRQNRKLTRSKPMCSRCLSSMPFSASSSSSTSSAASAHTRDVVLDKNQTPCFCRRCHLAMPWRPTPFIRSRIIGDLRMRAGNLSAIHMYECDKCSVWAFDEKLMRRLLPKNQAAPVYHIFGKCKRYFFCSVCDTRLGKNTAYRCPYSKRELGKVERLMFAAHLMPDVLVACVLSFAYADEYRTHGCTVKCAHDFPMFEQYLTDDSRGW